MIRDPTNDNVYRADKELEKYIDTLLQDPATQNRESLEQIRIEAGSYNATELHAKIQELGMKAPLTGAEYSFPEEFNLMFGTMIGPSGKHRGFLRPETA